MGSRQSTANPDGQPSLQRRISRLFSRSANSQSIVVRHAEEDPTNTHVANENNGAAAAPVGVATTPASARPLPGLESIPIPAPSPFRRLLSSTLERVGLSTNSAQQPVKTLADSADIAAAIKSSFANTPNPPLKEAYSQVISLRFKPSEDITLVKNCKELVQALCQPNDRLSLSQVVRLKQVVAHPEGISQLLFHSRLSSRCVMLSAANMDLLSRQILFFHNLMLLCEATSLVEYVTPQFADDALNALYKEMAEEERVFLLEMDPNRLRTSRLNSLDSLIMACNRDEESTLMLVNFGIIELCHTLCTDVSLELWQEDPGRYADSDHPEWWLAFDVLTNLCKWRCASVDLINLRVYEWLHMISMKCDNYFGFEATEGLAYLMNDRHVPQSFKSLFLSHLPRAHIKKIVDVFDATLHPGEVNNRATYYGMSFGVFGRVLAVRRLCRLTSESSELFELLLPALPLMGECVVDQGSNDFGRSHRLAIYGIHDLLKHRTIAQGEREEIDSFIRFFVNDHDYLRKRWADKCGVENEFGENAGCALYLMFCRYLKKSNKELNYRSTSNLKSPLMSAIESSFVSTKTLICDCQVNPVQYDDTGRSMLELACAGSSALVVSAYLDPYIKASDGAMIIPHLNSLLARVTDAEVARALCRFGAEFNLITKGDAWMKDGRLYKGARKGAKDLFYNFLMAGHSRLGKNCVPALQNLDKNVLMKILSYFVGGTFLSDEERKLREAMRMEGRYVRQEALNNLMNQLNGGDDANGEDDGESVDEEELVLLERLQERIAGRDVNRIIEEDPNFFNDFGEFGVAVEDFVRNA